MTFFAVLILTLFGWVVFLEPLDHAASAWSYRQGKLNPLDMSSLPLLCGGIGLFVGALALFGPYGARRLVVAVVSGFALAIPLVAWLPMDEAQRWQSRTDWKLAVAWFLAIAIWFAFQRAEETRDVHVKQMRQLQAGFWICLVAAIAIGVKGYLVIAPQADAMWQVGVSMKVITRNWNYMYATLVAGSGAMLCWLAHERLLECAPAPAPRELPTLRAKAAEEWRRPSI